MGKLATEAKAEKIKIDEPALELIAAIAEGSVRDAESLLDQIASLGGTITLADVERITGRTGLAKIAEFAAIIIRKDLPAALAALAALNDEGGNPVQFTKDLIHYLRKVLSLKLSPALEKIFERDLTKDEVAVVKKLGADADAAFLVTLEKAFIRAYSEMRYSPFAATPLEIALVENLKTRKMTTDAAIAKPNDERRFIDWIIAVLGIVLAVLLFFLVRQYQTLRREAIVSARESWLTNALKNHPHLTASDVGHHPFLDDVRLSE